MKTPLNLIESVSLRVSGITSQCMVQLYTGGGGAKVWKETQVCKWDVHTSDRMLFPKGAIKLVRTECLCTSTCAEMEEGLQYNRHRPHCRQDSWQYLQRKVDSHARKKKQHLCILGHAWSTKKRNQRDWINKRWHRAEHKKCVSVKSSHGTMKLFTLAPRPRNHDFLHSKRLVIGFQNPKYT